MSNTIGTFYKQYPGSTSASDDYLTAELHKLSAINGDLEVRCSQLVADCRLLEEENTNSRVQLERYAQTLEKMYRLHN